jgi:glutamyl-tRNA reductase
VNNRIRVNNAEVENVRRALCPQLANEAIRPAISVVGISHRTAPVSIREKLAIDQAQACQWLEGAIDGFAFGDNGRLTLRESVLLTTCNRAELYFLADGLTTQTQGVAAGPTGADLAYDALYYHGGAEAVAHLFSVASGIDSLVLGEYEIQAQVKHALVRALSEDRCGPVLARLFRHALRAGKRVRRETAISSGLFSVGQCAARKAQAILGDLRGKNLLLFGAGQVAHVTAKHMIEAGVGHVAVYSRTRQRAKALAQPLGATSVDALGLMAALRNSDILVGCASAPHHIVGCAEILEATRARDRRPLVVVDLGVPRNVDPEVGSLSEVHLFNIDDLEAVVAESKVSREAELEKAHAIVKEEVAAFDCCEAERGAAKVITQLLQAAEVVRRDCLTKVDHQRLPAEALQELDYLTDLLVRKLLHQPIAALRQAAAGQAQCSEDLDAAVRALFGFEEVVHESDRVHKSGQDLARVRNCLTVGGQYWFTPSWSDQFEAPP